MRESLDRRAKRGFALVLLLAALLVRGAIPQGYMAESTAPGTLTVTICHSDAVVQIPLGKKGTPARSVDPEPQPCVFSGYGAAVPPAEAASLPLPAAVAAKVLNTVNMRFLALPPRHCGQARPGFRPTVAQRRIKGRFTATIHRIVEMEPFAAG